METSAWSSKLLRLELFIPSFSLVRKTVELFAHGGILRNASKTLSQPSTAVILTPPHIHHAMPPCLVVQHSARMKVTPTSGLTPTSPKRLTNNGLLYTPQSPSNWELHLAYALPPRMQAAVAWPLKGEPPTPAPTPPKPQRCATPNGPEADFFFRYAASAWARQESMASNIKPKPVALKKMRRDASLVEKRPCHQPDSYDSFAHKFLNNSSKLI